MAAAASRRNAAAAFEVIAPEARKSIYLGAGGGVPVGGTASRVALGDSGTMTGGRGVGVVGMIVPSPEAESFFEVGNGSGRSGVSAADGIGMTSTPRDSRPRDLSSVFGLGSSFGKAFMKSTMLASMTPSPS